MRWFILTIIAILSLAVAGCTVDQGYTEEVSYPQSYCGDGKCTDSEMGFCTTDCGSRYLGPPIRQNPPDENIDESNSQQENTQSPVQPTIPNPSTAQNQPTIPVPIDSSISALLPETGFQVTSKYNLLGINDKIEMGTLTEIHLPETLRGGKLTSNTNAFGQRMAFYDQYLTLKNGVIRFGIEEDSDLLTSYLEWTEGEPIFDYNLQLRGGMWKFFEGQTINFLGHEYLITSVTEEGVGFYNGKDELLFRNGKYILWNGQEFGSNLNVSFDREHLRIMILAPDDIRILPGTTLLDYIKPETLLTNRLNLAYDGLTDSPSEKITIKKINNRYRMQFVNALNMNYTLNMASVNPFKLGGNDGFIYDESQSIKKGDQFLLTNRESGITNMLKIVSISYESNLISFQDPALETFNVYLQGDEKSAYADLVLHTINHRVYLNNKTAKIDLNGDGVLGGRVSIFPRLGKFTLNNDNSSLNLTFGDVYNTQSTIISITNSGIKISGVKLEERNNMLMGMNEYGTVFFLTRNIDADEQSGEDLTIIHPEMQRFANVILKAYE